MFLNNYLHEILSFGEVYWNVPEAEYDSVQDFPLREWSSKCVQCARVESPDAKRVIYRLSDCGRSARDKFTKPKVEVLAALGRDTGPISSRF